jgi:hypothetical protein
MGSSNKSLLNTSYIPNISVGTDVVEMNKTHPWSLCLRKMKGSKIDNK